MNSGFLITDVGLAAASAATPTGPYIHITEFRAGSGVNYTPVRSATGLAGTTLHIGVPSAYTVVDNDTVEVLLTMSPTVGTFAFGEIGLYLSTGQLFAVCVFDVPQDQIRAVGNQAGSTWKIRARIKLAQAASIIQVTLVNTQGILELPSWPNLAAPVNMLNDANIAIVHEDNSQGQSVTVVRNTDFEWTVLDYNKIFTASTTDGGITALSPTQFVHANASLVSFEDMPRTDSRYIVKFPDGSIRKVTGTVASGFSWTGTVSATQSGQITVWEVGNGLGRVNWADTEEFNWFAAEFNKYWANPIGPQRDAGPNQVSFPTLNKGKNQTPVALLNRRTTLADWSDLKTKVIRNCAIHGIPTADLASFTDFVYRPIAPNFPGLNTLRQQWDALVAKIALLESNRNTFAAAYDQVTLGSLLNDEFWYGWRNWEFTLDFGSDENLQAQLNSGYSLHAYMDWTAGTNIPWNTYLGTVETALNSILITPTATTINAPPTVMNGGLLLAPVGSGYAMLLSKTFPGVWGAQISAVSRTSGQLSVIFSLDSSSLPNVDYAGNDASIEFHLFSRRNQAANLIDPALPHPTLVGTTTYNGPL